MTNSFWHGTTKERLFMLLYRHQPIARSDLADLAGLTRPAVSNIVGEFLNKGLVFETHKRAEGVGRKKILLEINPKRCHAIGVDLGRRNVGACIFDLGGQILQKKSISFSNVKTLHENVGSMGSLLEELFIWSERRGITIDAVGIGVPGPVDPERGVSYSAPHFLSEETLNLKEIVETRFGVPTYVERDANAAALGELWFGEGRHCDSFVYLLVVEGIGSGLILSGSLYRGVHGLAGKLGKFVFPKLRNGEKVMLFEELGSEISALKTAEERASESEYLGKIVKQRKLNLKDLSNAARMGDPLVEEIVSKMEYYTALSVANIILFIDPRLIILGGDFVGIKEGFVENVRNHVSRILGDRPLPEIKPSPIYDMAISKGAAARAFMESVSVILWQDKSGHRSASRRA